MTEILLVKATFELQTPGGVHAPEQADEALGVDLPLARDSEGRSHVPATSLAGSLRAHLGPGADPLMGPDPGAEQTRASPLHFLGAEVTGQAKTVHRTRTAVDRARGAAAATTLRRSEHLAPGTRITVYLRLEDTTLTTQFIDALVTWQPNIGGGRTTGHGRATLVEARRRLIDLATPEGRRAWLAEGGPAMFADHLTEMIELPSPQPTEHHRVIEYHWDIVDGLHIGGERGSTPQTSEIDVLRDHAHRPYVPGTTWKGLLRSRCEFILRSLGENACPPATTQDPRHAGRAETRPCGSCLICRTFGYIGADSNPSGRRGSLVFHDSLIGDAKEENRTHVALDRVFGGAADKLLYTEKIVRSGQITLIVDALEPVDPAATALLTLACHDIHHGLLGVGSSTTRGLGTLRLNPPPDQRSAQRADAVNTLAAALSKDHPTREEASGR